MTPPQDWAEFLIILCAAPFLEVESLACSGGQSHWQLRKGVSRHHRLLWEITILCNLEKRHIFDVNLSFCGTLDTGKICGVCLSLSLVHAGPPGQLQLSPGGHLFPQSRAAVKRE